MMPRNKLLLRLIISGTLTWALLFGAYYEMLPYIGIAETNRIVFAAISSLTCFVALIAAFVFGPLVLKELKEKHESEEDED